MARKSPAEKLADIKRSLEAWEAHAPTSTFFGMTHRQFKDAVSPAIRLHEEAEAARRHLSKLIRARDVAQAKAMRLRQNVSFGISGDPKFGQDSLLYGRFGYVRKSARRKRRKKR
jgi:hypothetical protein